jgi:uncharacterized membrane protein YfcA
LPKEFAGIYVLAIIMGLGTMAGIGGGGIVIPLLMILFGFDTKGAIAISGFSIFLCSVVRYIVNIKEMHPEKNAVVIDYGLATIMLPTVLTGSLIGVFLNVMLPPLIL